MPARSSTRRADHDLPSVTETKSLNHGASKFSRLLNRTKCVKSSGTEDANFLSHNADSPTRGHFDDRAKLVNSVSSAIAAPDSPASSETAECEDLISVGSEPTTASTLVPSPTPTGMDCSTSMADLPPYEREVACNIEDDMKRFVNYDPSLPKMQLTSRPVALSKLQTVAATRNLTQYFDNRVFIMEGHTTAMNVAISDPPKHLPKREDKLSEPTNDKSIGSFSKNGASDASLPNYHDSPPENSLMIQQASVCANDDAVFSSFALSNFEPLNNSPASSAFENKVDDFSLMHCSNERKTASPVPKASRTSQQQPELLPTPIDYTACSTASSITTMPHKRSVQPIQRKPLSKATCVDTETRPGNNNIVAVASGTVTTARGNAEKPSLPLMSLPSQRHSAASDNSADSAPSPKWSPTASNASTARTSLQTPPVTPAHSETLPTLPTSHLEKGGKQETLQQILSKVHVELLPAVVSTFSALVADQVQTRLRDLILSETTGVHEHTANNHTASNGRQGPSTKSTAQSKQRSNGTSKGRGRKRPRKDDDGSGDEDEAHRVPGWPRETKDQPQKLLACHFHKSNPGKFRRTSHKKFKTCSNGFATPKLLKEHLKRIHTPKFYCQKCCYVFNTKQEEEDHLRQIQCQYWEHLEFRESYIMENDKLEFVKQKKPPRKSDEEHWFGIWDVLFPDKPRPASIYQEFTLIGDLLNQAIEIDVPDYIRRHATPGDVPALIRDYGLYVRDYVLDRVNGEDVNFAIQSFLNDNSQTSDPPFSSRGAASSVESAPSGNHLIPRRLNNGIDELEMATVDASSSNQAELYPICMNSNLLDLNFGALDTFNFELPR